MKVLIFHPHLNVKGGSERLTKLLWEGIKAQGQECLLATLKADPEWFREVIELEKPEDLKELVLQEAPDWVFITLSETRYAAMVKGLARVAIYVHFPLEEEVDDENFEEYLKDGRFLEVRPEELACIERIFVNSKRTALAVKSLWGREALVVHPPLEREFLQEGAKSEAFPPPTILCTGRFTPLKRQDFLILALEMIRKETPEATLVLAGFPDPRHLSYFKEVRKLAERIGGVEIVEGPSDEELLELYGKARVYAHPRIGEHFGISPCEAMARGIPVVIRGPTGLKDVTDRFIARSDWSFVKTLGEVLQMEEKEWRRIGGEMRHRVLNLTPERFASQILGGLQ